MAIKHINPNAKEESGVIVSGKEAKKIASILFSKNEDRLIKATKSFSETIKIARTLKF